MAKIENDKYYTSPELAKYCVEKTKEIIGSENITEYIEPSAGSGVFLDYLDKPYLAYDIEPEDERIVKQNYLELNLDYKKGRCIIGNPPFGTRNTLSVRFYKKAVIISDYISFILPISQLNNNQQMYEFDLIYSEDLGLKMYSDRNIHCCLNIYKRNIKGLNSKPNYKLKDVTIKEFRSKKLSIDNDDEFDLRICFWGNIGKVCDYKGQYAHEMGIKISNDKYKDKIITVIKDAKWNELYSFVATPALYQWQIYKYLKEKIPELK
jgi:hypothetical protein